MARTIVITGATTGIGCALKNSLVQQGYRVITIDILSADIEVDLASSSGIREAVKQIEQFCPNGIDGLVTCAGVGPNAESSSLIAALNFYGSIQIIEGLRPLLKLNKGKVVAIASNSALLPGVDGHLVDSLLSKPRSEAMPLAEKFEGAIAYASAKHGLIRWIRSNAPMYIGDGINLNIVAPGITKTPLTDKAFSDEKYAEAMEQFLKLTPYGEIGSPEMIAKPIEFLLSDAAVYMVGSLLVVDGGTDSMLRPSQF